MSLTANEILSIARFQHFSKRALHKAPAAHKTVLPALDELDRNYFEKISPDNLKKDEYQALLAAHNEIRRLGKCRKDTASSEEEDSIVSDAAERLGDIDRDTAVHEAPVRKAVLANKGSFDPAADEQSRDSNQSTTSAKQISTLLQSQKLISSVELETERKTHAAVTERMSGLTALLKETTLEMNRAIITQNMDLDQIQQHASENLSELDEQRKSLNKQQKSMTMGFWMGIYAYLFILAMFLFTYLIIRMFPAYPT